MFRCVFFLSFENFEFALKSTCQVVKLFPPGTYPSVQIQPRHPTEIPMNLISKYVQWLTAQYSNQLFKHAAAIFLFLLHFFCFVLIKYNFIVRWTKNKKSVFSIEKKKTFQFLLFLRFVFEQITWNASNLLVQNWKTDNFFFAVRVFCLRLEFCYDQIQILRNIKIVFFFLLYLLWLNSMSISFYWIGFR